MRSSLPKSNPSLWQFELSAIWRKTGLNSISSWLRQRRDSDASVLKQLRHAARLGHRPARGRPRSRARSFGCCRDQRYDSEKAAQRTPHRCCCVCVCVTSPAQNQKDQQTSREPIATGDRHPAYTPPFFFLGRRVLRCCGRSSSLSSYLFFSAFRLGREDTGAAWAWACVLLLLWSAFCCCWTGLEAPPRFEDGCDGPTGAPAPAAVPASLVFCVLAFFLEGAMAGEMEVFQLLAGESEERRSFGFGRDPTFHQRPHTETKPTPGLELPVGRQKAPRGYCPTPSHGLLHVERLGKSASKNWVD